MASGNVLHEYQPITAIVPVTNGAVLTRVPGTMVWGLKFHPDQDWLAVFASGLSHLYGDTTGYTIKLWYVTPKGATGAVRWAVSLKRIESDVDAADGGTYGTETASNDTVGSVAGEVKLVSLAIAKADDDALAAGDRFMLRVRRIGSNAGDTHTGEAYLVGVTVTET